MRERWGFETARLDVALEGSETFVNDPLFSLPFSFLLLPLSSSSSLPQRTTTSCSKPWRRQCPRGSSTGSRSGRSNDERTHIAAALLVALTATLGATEE